MAREVRSAAGRKVVVVTGGRGEIGGVVGRALEERGCTVVAIDRAPIRGGNAFADGPVIVYTGPLTKGALGEVIRQELSGDRMYFYDAIAPIVAADSIDWDFAFRGSRWAATVRPRLSPRPLRPARAR